MPEKGKLGYWDDADSGFLRLRGTEDGTVVWAGPVGYESTSERKRGKVSVRVDDGAKGKSRGALYVSDYHGNTGRLVLRGVPLPGETSGPRLVTMGQKNYRTDEETDALGTGREGAINIFHNNNLAASLYVHPDGFPLLELRDASGNVTITLDGSDGSIHAAGSIHARSLIALPPQPPGSDVVFGAGDYSIAAQNLYVTDEKNFAVPHPLDPTAAIHYGALEGPEAAIFTRGRIRLKRGRGSTRLPEHFRLLAKKGSLTCGVTSRSSRSKGLSVVRLAPGHVSIRETSGGRGNYVVDYVVFAARKTKGPFRVVRPRQ